MLEISDVNEITDGELEFADNTLGKQCITPDWVKWLWTSPVDKLNVAVIEFSPTALKILSRTKYERLTPDVPVENEEVSLWQYCERILNFGKGRIVKVNGESILYSSNIENAKYSSGFPLLNDKLKVVGIHVGSIDNNLPGRQIMKAINIKFIIEGFKTYVNENLGGKTENELWLEKINLIPHNELLSQYIGSGGYGHVYKIKIQTELALKIFQPVGKLNDYKAEASALEKEYRIVTGLGNHPRIIQFFGFVTDIKSIRLMIIMEYLEGGSLADKLEAHNPLQDNLVVKYLVQLLEGVSFLHGRNIYHSDIKPANILFTGEDNLKLSDFGIAVGIEWQTRSSATTSHIKGDFQYMSPERIKAFSRSAANDIWSIGATFIQMITGQLLNHFEKDNIMQFMINISQYKIFINGKPYSEYLEALNNNDFKKKIISRTLCTESNRAKCPELFLILFPYSGRLPPVALSRASEHNSFIWGLSYNSAGDELFLADQDNYVVRTVHLRDNAGDLNDVYRAPHNSFLSSVCHLGESNTLLLCLDERGQYGQVVTGWLVALSRNGSEWREAHRLKVDSFEWGISFALTDSQVLIGRMHSNFLEMFHVERGPLPLHIARVCTIDVPEPYWWFSANCSSDTLVAITFRRDQSVRVHRLRGNRLEEFACVQLKNPYQLLWLADRLLVTEWIGDWDAVIEFEVIGSKQIQRRSELIDIGEHIKVARWCALNDGFAISDYNSRELLHYSHSIIERFETK